MKFLKEQKLIFLLEFLLAILAGYALVGGASRLLLNYEKNTETVYAKDMGKQAQEEINRFLEGEDLRRLLGEKAVLKEPLHYTYENQETAKGSCVYLLSEDTALTYGFSQPFFVEIDFTLGRNGTILETEVKGKSTQAVAASSGNDAVMAEISLSRSQMEAILNSYGADWWKENTNSLTGNHKNEFQVYIEKAPDVGKKPSDSYELAVFCPEKSKTWSQRFLVKPDSSWKNNSLLWEEGDYNFDGYTDGRLGKNRGPYRYFIWNPQKGELEEDQAGLKNIQNVLFLEENQVMLGAEEKAEGVWNYTMYRYYGQGIGRLKEMEVETNTSYTKKLMSKLQDFFGEDLTKSIREYLNSQEIKEVVGEDAGEQGSFGYVEPQFGFPVYQAVFTISQKQREHLGIPVEQIMVDLPIKKDFSRIDKPDFYAVSTDSQASRRYTKEDLLAAKRHRQEGLEPLKENETEIYVALEEGMDEFRVHFEMLHPIKENLGAYLYEMKVYKAGALEAPLQTMQFKSNMGIRDSDSTAGQCFNPVFEDVDKDGVKELKITRLISTDEIYDYYKWNKRKGRFYLEDTKTVSGKQPEE